jgi:hypothetical protein
MVDKKKDAKVASAKAGKKGPSQGPAKVIDLSALSGGTVTSFPGRPSPSTDEGSKAMSAYDAARVGIAKVVPGDRASEGKFSTTYQKLVQLGLAPQIRKKYR